MNIIGGAADPPPLDVGGTNVHISRRGSVRISRLGVGPSPSPEEEREEQEHEEREEVNAENSERAFKERYAVLKSIYEQRIESLAGQVDTALSEVQSDPIRRAQCMPWQATR